MQKWQILFLSMFIIIVNFGSVTGQTTEFTYQGYFKDGPNPATTSYDFEFALFDMLVGGNQVGSTLARNNVLVTAGIFAVKLDFGPVFPGANRYMEIRARLAGQPGITVLAPRQLLNSLPYAVKSLNTDNATTATNATQLGGVAASQYVLTTDVRLSNARQPTPGSANYIQNQNLGAQLASNFNISGDGTIGGDLSVVGSLNLNIVNATQYNIGGTRVLGSVGTNLFAGPSAGPSTIGGNNSFFGNQAGQGNVGGSSNSFFGKSAGIISTGNSNSFFGASAGDSNLGGGSNSFFGTSAGTSNSTGASNTFIGRESGFFNTTGSNNTALGLSAGPTSGALTFATAIGAGATVAESDTIVLGRNTGADQVQIPGPATIGSTLVADGQIKMNFVSSAGLTTLCLNGATYIANCSSSLRYKTNIDRFGSGLSMIKQLTPISYNWKDGGMRDIGFGAEDVAKIDTRFVTYNSKGEVEGVKYERLTTVFVNAFQEQQQQIDAQQKQIEALKAIVCSIKPEVDACSK